MRKTLGTAVKLTVSSLVVYLTSSIVHDFMVRMWPVVIAVLLVTLVVGPEVGRLRYTMQRSTPVMREVTSTRRELDHPLATSSDSGSDW